MQFVIYIVCVAVVIGVVFFRNQQNLARGHNKLAGGINELTDRITELQVLQLITNAQTRALTVLSAKIWREAGVRMPDGKSFEQMLQTMTEEQKEHLLASFAKVDPKGAAKLKDAVEKSLRRQNHSNEKVA